MVAPNETAGGSSKTAASSKNMKRCSHCGAKNKDTFEYCVRCSESLEDGGGSWSEPAETSSSMALIVGIGVVGIIALAITAIMTAPSDESPAPVANARSAEPAPALERREPVLEDVASKELMAVYRDGIAAFNREDYDLAVELFAQVVDELPNNYTVARYLGMSHYNLGDFDDAMDALEGAFELRPDSFSLLADYVSACKDGGDVERALEALQGYVADHPNELDARLEIARLARASGNDALAIAQSEYLATADNLDPEFIYEYGVTLKEAGQFDEAKAVLKNAIELEPDSAIAHHALGVTELTSGNAGGALTPLEEAVALQPTNGDFRFSLAQAYEKLDRIEESLDAYDAYLEHARPDDARAEPIRRQLEIAKKALAAEREQKRQAEQTQGS